MISPTFLLRPYTRVLIRLSEGSLGTAAIANSRKRGAEIDAAMDGMAVKKKRMGKEIDMIQ